MRRSPGILLALLVFGIAAQAFALSAVPPADSIANWSAPLYWQPTRDAGARQTMDAAPAFASSPDPFIAIAPCRVADTRGNGFTGAYGPPSLAAGSPRSFVMTGQCGIGPNAEAVSLNITVTNTQGPGFILIFPAGGTPPTVSTLNYVAGQTIANAALVPLGTGGAITVIAGVSGADIIIDTNGYYDRAIPHVSARYQATLNQAIPGDLTPTIVDFDTKDWDTANAVTTGANWVFTAPFAGYYHVEAHLVYGVTTTWPINSYIDLLLVKNGVFDRAFGLTGTAGDSLVGVGGGIDVFLAKNDTISVETQQNSGTTRDLGNPTYCVVGIHRIQ